MITAIVPCYNGAAYLGEAIASVQRQTRPVDEVIVVDDCSTDNSVEIAKQYGVRLLSTPENQGHAAARNVAIHAAQGEVIVWLDADDYWAENHVETVVGLLEKFPEADVAYTGIETFGGSNWKWSDFPCEEKPLHLVEECFDHTIVPAMSAATRLQALLEVGGFDSHLRTSPDFDLWLRMSVNHKFVCSREITAFYRTHANQISSQRYRQLDSVYRTRIRFLQTLREHGQHAQVAILEQQLAGKFQKDLWKSWYRKDERCLCTLIMLADQLQGGSDLVREMGLRRYVPSIIIRWLRKLKNRC